MNESEILIIGSKGQLGTALRNKYPKAKAIDIDELDISDKKSVLNFKWDDIKTIINAAAYTNVDGSETPEGRIIAWKANAVAPANLSYIAQLKKITLVHISSDYVFDGSETSHTEEESFSPLSVYGDSKAAGDIAVGNLDNHYIIRTSWVIGQGKNFVRTMLDLGSKGINPTVVNDQIGRLTFTSELIKAIDFLLINNSPYGTYNVSNSGEISNWADITRKIFKLANLNNTVTDISTDKYYDGKTGIAPRPLNSTLDLSKISSLGFKSTDWLKDLETYIKMEAKWKE